MKKSIDLSWRNNFFFKITFFFLLETKNDVKITFILIRNKQTINLFYAADQRYKEQPNLHLNFVHVSVALHS